MFKLIPLAISLALCAAGCSASADSTGQFDAALEDAQSENGLHASHCLHAASVGAMASEMARHEQVMPRTLDQMDQALSHVSSCFSDAPAGMHGMMSGLRADDEAHVAHMSEATTLTAQVAECQSYTDATRIKLDRMSRMMEISGGHCMM